MNLDKEVFTTFEAATICNANVSSIKNWIEQGEVDAFRTPGGHYRIQRHALSDFLDRHGMPNPLAAREARRLLIAGFADDARLALAIELEALEIDLLTADNPTGALLTLGVQSPDFFIIGPGFELTLRTLLMQMESHEQLERARVIALYEGTPPLFEHERLTPLEVPPQTDALVRALLGLITP